MKPTKPSTGLALVDPARGVPPSIVEQHRGTLRLMVYEGESGNLCCHPPDTIDQLPPRRDLMAMRTELGRGLAPATTDQTMMAAAALVGAYRKADLENPEIFMRSLLEDLAEYPADILGDMVRELRRTLKWFPTIAECRTVCDKLVSRRRLEARAVELMLREQDRREQEAAVKAERERQERERLSAWHARLCVIYGAALVPDLFTLSLAERGMRYALGHQERGPSAAAERGETWAIVTLWRSAIAYRAVLAGSDRHLLTPQQAVAMRSLIEDTRERWPAPAVRDGWQIAVEHTKTQSASEREAWLAAYMAGDAEKSAIVAELVRAEAERVAAASTGEAIKAATLAAFAELGLPIGRAKS